MDKISSDVSEAKLISGKSLERASSSMSSESSTWRGPAESGSAALDFLRVMTIGPRVGERSDNGSRPRADYVTTYP